MKINNSDINILIAESDLIIRENLSEYLESFGYAVNAVATKDELLGLITIKPSQVILLESCKSEQWAIETIREINSKCSTTVVMIMLANPTMNKILNLMNIGIQHILIKPLSLNDFGKSIKKAVLQYRNNFDSKIFNDNKSLILKSLEEQGVVIFNSQGKNLTTSQEV